jgi:hypothetical protein
MDFELPSVPSSLVAGASSGMEWAWFGIAATFAFALLPFLMYGLRRLFEGPAAREFAILEKELARKDLDPARRDQIIDKIATRVATQRPGTSLMSRMMVGLGWVGLVIGIAIASMTYGVAQEGAIYLAIAGGTLMTLPFIIREWDRRSGTAHDTPPFR